MKPPLSKALNIEEPRPHIRLAFIAFIRKSPALTALYTRYLHARKGLPLSAGWDRSFREMSSVDAGGKPIPWITYSALQFLESRIRKDFRVFEYGCGNSTLWWANRVQQVTSCESDEQWVRRIIACRPANAKL
ncbi:MAG: hypothetical protein V2A34_05480, partial [Lentisphaerota bacterium]